MEEAKRADEGRQTQRAYSMPARRRVKLFLAWRVPFGGTGPVRAAASGIRCGFRSCRLWAPPGRVGDRRLTRYIAYTRPGAPRHLPGPRPGILNGDRALPPARIQRWFDRLYVTSSMFIWEVGVTAGAVGAPYVYNIL